MISYTPGRFTWPDTATMRVPGDVALPIAVYAAEPLRMSHGKLAMVSTLFTMVGLPYRPMAAGKNGGFKRGMPRLPSRLSMSAVSSPTTYAPAPQCNTMSSEKSEPRMFRPT
ncbi:unannotated protein [freshwater metagenome]|uniref:Unannotated protein n=1 Tax=freshwater metagenome TaxID=449393 RepID=A0A6J6YK22_9ZZZZ